MSLKLYALSGYVIIGFILYMSELTVVAIKYQQEIVSCLSYGEKLTQWKHLTFDLLFLLLWYCRVFFQVFINLVDLAC